MSPRPACLVGLSLAALLLAAPAARAQSSDPGPISTASGAAPPPAAVNDAAPLPLNTAPDNAAPEGRDGKVHGMAEVGVGTNGYRHAAVVMEAPLQGGGEVAVAVSDTQFDGGGGRRRERAAPAN
jgi:hypothetical protein